MYRNWHDGDIKYILFHQRINWPIVQSEGVYDLFFSQLVGSGASNLVVKRDAICQKSLQTLIITETLHKSQNCKIDI